VELDGAIHDVWRDEIRLQLLDEEEFPEHNEPQRGIEGEADQRAVLHLHGGNTPWISDGTPHQWITPAGDAVANATGFAKGFSAQNVPDMPGALGFTPSLTDGKLTYYWTNQQSGRLMFYHEHAYGTTRLGVYAGAAAGYLLTDPAQEKALAAATAPGTIITDPATGQM
jgi:hypothetical protein